MICLCVVEVCIAAEGECCGDCEKPWPSTALTDAAQEGGEGA